MVFAKLRRAEPTRAPHRPGVAIRISLQREEVLLLTLAQALEAGLTFEAFARGPMTVALPATARAELQAAAKAGGRPSEVLFGLGVLDATEVALLGAGEVRGAEASVLRLLAHRREETRLSLRRLLIGLTYPGLLLLGAILVRPLPSLVLEGVEAYLRAIGPPLLGLVLVITGARLFLFRLPRDSKVPARVRRVIQSIPPFSWVARARARSTFFEVFGAGLAAGLSMREALPLASKAAAHPALAGHAQALARLEHGETLTEALTELLGVPPQDRPIIAHGEQTGRLDEVLPRLAADHAQRARTITWAIIGVSVLIATVLVMGWMARTIIAGYTAQFEALNRALDVPMR